MRQNTLIPNIWVKAIDKPYMTCIIVGYRCMPQTWISVIFSTVLPTAYCFALQSPCAPAQGNHMPGKNSL